MNDREVIIRLRQLMTACDSAALALNQAFSMKVEPYAQSARASATLTANDVYKLLSQFEREKKEAESCNTDA